jgi:hypothetical protein
MMNFDYESFYDPESLGIPDESPITSLGFTGTRRGLTATQRRVVEEVLLSWLPPEIHHGDFVGADAEFHEMVRELIPDARIIIHPPQNPRSRAFCKGDEYQPERPHLVRSKDIVSASHLLLAAPGESTESATWSTIRQARQASIWMRIVLPDEETK